jgi:hypothetical protein
MLRGESGPSGCACFASQTTDRGPGLGPVLTPGMIAHFTRAMEVVFR